HNREVARNARTEQTVDTRAALLAAARKRFAEQGYAATGTEEIVADAQVTRGALYHHFKDKAELFRTVMEQVARDVAEQLVAGELARTQDAPTDALTQLRQGFRSLLDISTHSDFQRIVLIDGPAVLGTEAWETLVEQHGLRLLGEWLDRAVQERSIDPIPVPPLARLMVALLSQASLYVARSEDPATAATEAGEVLDRLLTGLGHTRAA
nr:TetR/AcrR family transcriptional regulator [Micromonospora sp. DSM 115978]